MVADAALRRLDVTYNIEIIGNTLKFHKYNIQKSPALLIDGNVVLEGYEPSLEEMMDIIRAVIQRN